VDKSQKAALFVFVTLAASLVAGLILYVAYAAEIGTAVPLLVACVLVAFGFVLTTARLVAALRRSRVLQEAHSVPPGRLLVALSQRQWLTLLVGVAVIALTTGAATGVRILAANPVPTPTPTIALPTPGPTTAAATTTAPTDTPSPIPTPSISITPSDASPTPSGSGSGPEEDTSLKPSPGTTKYIDSERTLVGGADAKAVTFNAQRYLRGISFYCEAATNSILQWNVAGYTKFTAVGGIDDNTSNAFGAATEFVFYDQDGRQLLAKPVQASVGHPQKIELDLTNVVSLRMTCSAHDSKTGRTRYTYAAFGDPVIISS
jgi:hypothetical protein